MTMRTMLPPVARSTRVALVWIDHEHAVIVRGDARGTDAVACLDRALHEDVDGFEARTVHQVVDEERVVVSGQTFARTSFERAYVAVTHRPDRLIDVEPTVFG